MEFTCNVISHAVIYSTCDVHKSDMSTYLIYSFAGLLQLTKTITTFIRNKMNSDFK